MTSICVKIYDHNVVQELNYTIEPYQGRNAISGQVIYKIDVNNITSLLTFDLEREGKPAYRILSKKFDACKFLEGFYKQMPLANSLLKRLNKMKNFPKSCPLKAYEPIVLDLFIINWQQLPIYLPNMGYTVTAEFFTNGKKFSEIILKGKTSQS
ncbi:uncharacterized protein LOC128921604 [Zeugodacus cucurbitae]|uniref:uncharacterized protein LOC128921604 n=1 Tax=Zeugodacus cucurbitae TaxID=28588 RepID=UPI0023D8F56F|nr:uncharacterized protein LOC128921604 [Zeugodacus cucurbitae]